MQNIKLIDETIRRFLNLMGFNLGYISAISIVLKINGGILNRLDITMATTPLSGTDHPLRIRKYCPSLQVLYLDYACRTMIVEQHSSMEEK